MRAVSRSGGFAALLFVAGLSAPAAVMAQPDVLGAYFRADEALPQFYRFWHESFNLPDDPDPGAAQYASKHLLGGSVHVYVHNTQSQALAIEDVLLEDMSLTRCLKFSDQRIKRKFASIHFADLPEAEIDRLIAAGEPIWWKVDPQQIPPGETGEVVVRLRQRPQAAKVRLGLKHAGGTKEVAIPVLASQLQIAGIAFSRDLGRVHLYFRRSDETGGAPTRIMIDGQDVTRHASIVSDPAVDLVPAEVRLRKPLSPGSFHCFQGVYRDGLTASAGVRAWADEIAYGMWGSLPTDESQTALARGYVLDITNHNINVQMPQVGSAGVQAFYKSEAGKRVCKSRGLRLAISDPGKYGTKDPLMYFIHDEPDAGDYKMEGVASDRRVGGLAQWAVGRTHKLRDGDPATPQFLNIDSTFRPESWYIYGQLPDILATDPYYQTRLCTTYWRNPHRLAKYVKATYIYGTACTAFSACAPKPLHMILNVVRIAKKGRAFRFATPQEKRIEVYYSLAGGAKGISYWWFHPGSRKTDDDASKSDGIGVARHDGEAAALWKEIGLLGAEVRTAGPMILQSCPVETETEVSEPTLWPRCLLAGVDTLVLIVVNEQYANDRVGTVYVPIDEANVTLQLPSWLEPKAVFEINYEGTQDVAWKVKDSCLELDLGKVELTRMVVVSKNVNLRAELQDLYRGKFAAKVARLMAKRRTSRRSR